MVHQVNINDFRANVAYTSRLADIFSDPVFQMATEILRQSNEPVDPEIATPEIASTRVLSQMVGFNTYAKTLRSMCFPIVPIQEIPTEFKPEILQS
jgi:hypothetical protein